MHGSNKALFAALLLAPQVLGAAIAVDSQSWRESRDVAHVSVPRSGLRRRTNTDRMTHRMVPSDPSSTW